MAMTSIRCPVLGAHVTLVTDLEGKVTRIICAEYEEATGARSLNKAALEGGPLAPPAHVAPPSRRSCSRTVRPCLVGRGIPSSISVRPTCPALSRSAAICSRCSKRSTAHWHAHNGPGGCGSNPMTRAPRGRTFGVTVRAFNISSEQIAYARNRAKEGGLADRVEFVEDDYRHVRGNCDAFVSLGMLEQALALRLLDRPWFVRHVLLDRWFLHAQEPALALS